MNYTIQLHPLVQQDYDEAYEWYEDKQQDLGERFLNAVRNKPNDIALHPEFYGSKGSKKFRETKIDMFPYLIVYKINKRRKQIYVSSVHHAKKHPNKKYRQG